MIIDRLCRIVETNEEVSDLRPFLSDARLFVLDSDTVPSPSQADAFSLPFATTAVTFAARQNDFLVIWRQTADDWSCGYQCVVALRVAHLCGFQQATPNHPSLDALPLDPDGTILIHGSGRLITDAKGYRLILGPFENRQWYCRSEAMEPIDIRAAGREFLDWLAAAVQFSAVMIAAINDPAKFVLEARPVSAKVKSGTIPRSHQRPNYVILHPREIRQRMNLPDPDHGGPTKAPHERRGHYREYRSMRFVHVKGQRKWIEATWIGPAESVVGKKQYRVILDRLGS